MTRLVILLLLTSICFAANAAETRISIDYHGALKPDGSTGAWWTIGSRYWHSDGIVLEQRGYIRARLWGLKGATVTGAQLRIYIPFEGNNFGYTESVGYSSVDASETLALFGFDQDVDALLDGTGGTAAFAALASGPELGVTTVSADSMGQLLTIDLNQQGIAYIQDAIDAMPSKNEGGDLVIGAALTSIGQSEHSEYVKGNIYNPFVIGASAPLTDLVIVTEGPVDEPGAGAYRIDATGKFQAACDNPTACVEAGLDGLVGQTFTASIVIPKSSQSVVAEDPDRTRYLISHPRANFSFDTQGNAFDYDRYGEVNLTVQHCAATQTNANETGACYGWNDTLEFALQDGSAGRQIYFYLRSPSNQQSWLQDGEIPSMVQLTSPALFSGFEICDAEYKCIGTYDGEDDSLWLDSVEISWIPYVEMNAMIWDDANIVDLSDDSLISVSVSSSNIGDGDEANDFDATEIDPANLRLGLGDAQPVTLPWVLDVDGDADLDMAVTFRMQDSGILCGDTELYLTGNKQSGDEFMAVDSIETVGCVENTCHP